MISHRGVPRKVFRERCKVLPNGTNAKDLSLSESYPQASDIK